VKKGCRRISCPSRISGPCRQGRYTVRPLNLNAGAAGDEGGRGDRLLPLGSVVLGFRGTKREMAPQAMGAGPCFPSLRGAHGGMLSTLSDLLILAGFMGMALVASLLGLFVASIVRQNAERRRMIGELNTARGELARAEREAGALEERQRLAGEIHDTIAQGLTSIVLQLQSVEHELTTDPPAARARVNTAIAMAREGLSEARRVLWALRPDLLQNGHRSPREYRAQQKRSVASKMGSTSR